MVNAHRNGPCTVSYGSMYGFNGCMIENPSVLLDVDMEDDRVVLVKYGPKDGIKEYFDNMVQRYKANGFDNLVDSLRFISFNTLTGFPEYDEMTKAKFTTDEICTMINWLNNHISAHQLNDLFTADESTMHERLKQLAEIGF